MEFQQFLILGIEWSTDLTFVKISGFSRIFESNLCVSLTRHVTNSLYILNLGFLVSPTPNYCHLEFYRQRTDSLVDLSSRLCFFFFSGNGCSTILTLSTRPVRVQLHWI
eukprot:TRINITY_DN8599_c0_g1_i5.p2 TRINITY_DN8599_c0_g1~~TRINITY_DN8599_c0_g1_i5.p2  ORF type:complete len:109 (+),score=8.22 TRINITY_DN8599_c0_g1_i5:576-902(+)